MIDMTELMTELSAAPMREWHYVPVTANRHKWLLQWCRYGDGRFFFCFESPKKRRYFFWAARGENSGRVTGAEVALANGDTIVDYREIWGDSPARLDAVLRLTPQHVLDRLSVLLDAIG